MSLKDDVTKAMQIACGGRSVVTPIELTKVTKQRPQAIYNMIPRYVKGRQVDVLDSEGNTARKRWIIDFDDAVTYATGYLTRKATRITS